MSIQDSHATYNSTVCKAFSEKHGISPQRITGHNIDAVYWLEHSQNAIDTSFKVHAERLVNEPTWGLLQAMLDRVHEHASASLLLFIIGQPSSSEVVARTTVEAAINVLYVLNGNRVERLWHYLFSYIATERKQNKLWLDTIAGYSDDDTQVHLSGMAQKETALNIYETVLSEAFKQMGILARNNASWPPLFERFRSVGKADIYRTVYAAISSQAHNDAEDLVNRFIIYATGKQELQSELNKEAINFSRTLVYFGLQHYIEACLTYAASFGLSEAEEELRKGYTFISRLVAEVAQDLWSSPG